MITSSFKFFISTVHIIFNNENDNDNDNNNYSLRILTDSSTSILFNSVHQVMLQMTIWKVNAYSRNVFHIVNERASFPLHARSFDSPRLIVSIQSACNQKAAWRYCLVKVKQEHSACQKIVLLSGSGFWSICSLCVKVR